MTNNTAIDRMREEFEGWVHSEWPKAPLLKYNSGDYRSETVQQSWTAWQASRNCLQVSISCLKPEVSGQVVAGVRLSE